MAASRTWFLKKFSFVNIMLILCVVLAVSDVFRPFHIWFEVLCTSYTSPGSSAHVGRERVSSQISALTGSDISLEPIRRLHHFDRKTRFDKRAEAPKLPPVNITIGGAKLLVERGSSGHELFSLQYQDIVQLPCLSAALGASSHLK